MAKAPAFMWYPKDCDTDEQVKGMDDAEFGFYVRCLNHAWLNNGLPVEISEFARVMGKTPKQLLKLWVRVSRCFSENSEKRFVNLRQEQQRTEQESFRKSRVEAAKSMHANKSSLHVHPKTDAPDMHVQCSALATALATAIPTKNKEDQDHIAPAVAEAPIVIENPVIVWFEAEFWPSWIRRLKDVKESALIAAKTRATTVAIRAEIMGAVHRMKAARMSEDPEFRVSARRWLKDNHWKSEPELPQAGLFKPNGKQNFVDSVVDVMKGRIERGDSPL